MPYVNSSQLRQLDTRRTRASSRRGPSTVDTVHVAPDRFSGAKGTTVHYITQGRVVLSGFTLASPSED